MPVHIRDYFHLAAFLKISFGDQVQFFPRQSVVDRNLFPASPLIEDVELSIRLDRLGKQTFYLPSITG